MYQEIHNYNTILIDLDDTLYPEEAFLFAAYKNIATFLSKKYELPSHDIYDFLTLEFKQKGRYNLFDKLIDIFHLKPHTVSSCLSIMRQTLVNPKILLFPASKALLQYCIRNNKKVFVITNGNMLQQRNKVASILWDGIDHQLTFIWADAFAPKPSPLVWESYLFPCFKLDINQTVMIGDSIIDMLFANNITIPFINISTFKL